MTKGDTRLRKRGRLALAVSLLGVLIVTPMVGFGVYQWLWTLPAAPRVELTTLPVPAPGDLLDWSLDGKRLLVANRRGEMWVVEPATGRISALPVFRPTLWGIMWGPNDRPLAFAFENPALTRMWTLAGDEWKLLPHRGVQPIPAPNRERVAYLTGRDLVREYWHSPRRRVDAGGFQRGRFVRVADLMTGATVRDIPLPALEYPQVHWADDRILIVRGQINKRPQVFQCSIESGTLEPAKEPNWPPKEPAVRLEFVSTPIRDQELRNRLAKLGLPGLPQTDERDWWLIVRDSRGAEMDRYALGRRDPHQRPSAGTYHSWKHAWQAPNRARWAVFSAYDTLHLLEIPGVATSDASGHADTWDGSSPS